MEEYLFLISIGPVQSFIASARRTRDLWFGSTLLSELARESSIKIVKESSENMLIFPAISRQDLQSSNQDGSINVANKIIAHIHQPPQNLAEKVHEAIFERLHKLRDIAYKDIGDSDFDLKTARAQVDDLVEFLWVALPYEGKNYAPTRNRLEALMAARKNTRDFKVVGWGSTQKKSSIDGQLESVIPEYRYLQRGDNDAKRLEKAKFLYDHYKAGPSEQLSGVDVLKRLGRLSSNISVSSVLTSFPSTSHIAAIPFLQRLDSLSEEDKKQAKTLWEKYVNHLKSISVSLELETIPPKKETHHDITGNYEGSLLFEERWIDLVGDPNSVRKGEKAISLQKAKETLGNFFHFVDKRLGKNRPNPYYAILLADGDRMGKAIDMQAKNGEEAHQKLSLALSEFAKNVRAIVEEQNQGALIYAGGDDILAFIPLHKVLECAQALRKDFRDRLKPFKDDEGQSPTLSVGVVIIHHLSSLRDALALARQAEQRAKHIPDKKKNALAITISKRSGDDYTIAGHWEGLDKYLEKLIGYCITDDIPDGTAYELRDLALRLALPNDLDADSEAQKKAETLREAMLKEAERVLQRKLKLGVSQSKQGQLDAERIKEVEQTLLERLRTKTQKSDDPSANIISLEQFSHELIIAQTLADAQKLATPKGTI